MLEKVGFKRLGEVIEPEDGPVCLELIVCEPSSRKPGPNRLLQRLGFRIVTMHRTIPRPLNRKHEVHRYENHSSDGGEVVLEQSRLGR